MGKLYDIEFERVGRSGVIDFIREWSGLLENFNDEEIDLIFTDEMLSDLYWQANDICNSETLDGLGLMWSEDGDLVPTDFYD